MFYLVVRTSFSDVVLEVHFMRTENYVTNVLAALLRFVSPSGRKASGRASRKTLPAVLDPSSFRRSFTLLMAGKGPPLLRDVFYRICAPEQAFFRGASIRWPAPYRLRATNLDIDGCHTPDLVL